MTLLLTSTFFLSAFLLFSCEPMVAKMVLPVLGGSASVWTTCVVFFQIMLLVGYAYAHFVGKIRLGRQYGLHLLLMLLAFTFLPIRFSAAPGNPSGAPITWTLLHLLAAAGLPFAILSATAPLLQTWLAQTTLPWADDPYFLYAVSNAGSLLALAAYPTVFEPRFGVSDQSRLWLYGYALLLAVFAASMWMMWGSRIRSAMDRKPRVTEDSPLEAATWTTRLQWLAAAFVPSALTLAVTNHISLNLGSFPFLWVAPLGLYLLTFVLAFARKFRMPLTIVSSAATIVIVLLFPIATVGAPVRSSELWPLIAAHLLILFVAALLCHSFVAVRRPQTSQLTEFYFILALGGVLGGVFTAIIAPAVFSTVLEYPLLVAAAGFFRQLRKPGAAFGFSDAFDLLLFGLFVGLVMTAVLSWGKVDVTLQTASVPVLAAQSVLVLALALFRWKRLLFGMAFSALVLTYAIVLPREFEGATRVHIARDFFGVKKVLFEPDINMRKLLHGDTLHGRQSLDPALTNEPLTYYHRTGPVGDAMTLIVNRPSQNVGVVGLGTGSIAAYGTKQRHISFFDIDPQMIDVATSFFTYVRHCGEACGIVIGDGRLSIQAQPDGKFDLLILDAFNSDSIPAHLVSREAVRSYMSKLKPDGLLMFHVSNRYLDVEKLVSSVLAAEGIPAFVRHDTDEEPPGKSGSHYVLALKHPEALEHIPHRDEWIPIQTNTGIRPWTDDFSNLVSIIK